MSASPQRTPTHNNNPLESNVGSRGSSRAASPALEATETELNHPQNPSGDVTPTATTTDEGLIAKSDASATVTAATRRKSSTWKAFNIKKQLIKVDSRLRNTFVIAASPEPPPPTKSTFYTDGDVSAASASTTPTNVPLAFAHNDRNEYLEQIESEIVQSLNEVQATGNDESIADATESLTLTNYDSVAGHSAVVTPRSILNTNNNSGTEAESCSPLNVAISKRVEFCEEPPMQRVSFVSPVEGAFVSRPADLPLTESNTSTSDDVVDRPVPPPRSGKYKNNKQRLLSVPNIKYAKQQQPSEFPMRGKMSVGHKDSLANLLPTTTTTMTGSLVVSGGGGGPNLSNINVAGTAPGTGTTSSSFANSFMRRFSKYLLRGPKRPSYNPLNCQRGRE